MTFRDQEKQRYETIKTNLWPGDSGAPGTYRGKPRPFCLADGHSAENLYEDFRNEAVIYFRERHIDWHDGWPDDKGHKRKLPSNHLCSSQVACVNTLFPPAQDGRLLTRVFRPFFPEFSEPVNNVNNGRECPQNAVVSL